MSTRRWSMFGLVFACTLLSVSCVSPCFLPGMRRTAAPTPLPTLPPSQGAAKRFEEKARSFEGSTFRVEFTDEEVTSFVALNVADSLPFSAPRVAFQPGTFTLEGDITSPVRGHLTITGTIQVADGKPKIVFRDASVAGIALPQAALNSISDTVSSMILQEASSVQIERIELLAGRIVITGRNADTP